jgi:hypothetical protein
MMSVAVPPHDRDQALTLETITVRRWAVVLCRPPAIGVGG